MFFSPGFPGGGIRSWASLGGFPRSHRCRSLAASLRSIGEAAAVAAPGDPARAGGGERAPCRRPRGGGGMRGLGGGRGQGRRTPKPLQVPENRMSGRSRVSLCLQLLLFSGEKLAFGGPAFWFLSSLWYSTSCPRSGEVGFGSSNMSLFANSEFPFAEEPCQQESLFFLFASSNLQPAYLLS